ncbi:hypothetical protein [Maridesulfovibrio sp.]|uniref:hypothetical protein n=1 Tax=Maridesulfovibrio sp. TaxID=2795000 RepID=UPI003BA985B1
MADFIGTVPTRYGLELLGLLGTGVTLNFTRAAVGSGVWNQEQVDSPAEMEALVNEAMSLAISPESVKPVSIPKSDEPVGMYEVSVFLTNAGLQDGFALREIGIFADHPTRGEILFAVDYAGDRSDYIPALPANAAPLEKIFKMAVLTGLAKEITVNQSPVLLATHDDIGDHNTNPEAHQDMLDRRATGTPEILSPANGDENVGETPIYRFREFVPYFARDTEEAIQVQIDLNTGNFSNPVHDSGFLSTISSGYEQPAGMLQAGKTKYKVRCRRKLKSGLISEWSEVVVFETREVFTYVKRPIVLTPANGATNVLEQPMLSMSAFAVIGGEDTHAADQYRVLNAGGEVIWTSPELTAGEAYKLLAGLLKVDRDYSIEGRHKGTVLGWSEWSTVTRISTAPVFLITDEAAKPQTWIEYVNASAAGVALDYGAVLRSNPVLQGDGESDWMRVSARIVIRGSGHDVDARTTETSFVSLDPIADNDEFLTDKGIVTAKNVTEEAAGAISRYVWTGLTANNPLVPVEHEGDLWDAAEATWSTSASLLSVDAEGWAEYGVLNIPGTLSIANTIWKSDGWTFLYRFKDIDFSRTRFLEMTFVDGYPSEEPMPSGGDEPGIWVYSYSGKLYLRDGEIGRVNVSCPAPADNADVWIMASYSNGSAHIGWSYGANKPQSFDDLEQHAQVDNINFDFLKNITPKRGSLLGSAQGDSITCKIREFIMASSGFDAMKVYTADISAAGLTEPPTLVHRKPSIGIATGAADAAFANADYTAVDIESATLVTDDDPTNPKAVVIDTVKTTPTNTFRKIAIEVKPTKGDETRIDEVTFNLDKQG